VGNLWYYITEVLSWVLAIVKMLFYFALLLMCIGVIVFVVVFAANLAG